MEDERSRKSQNRMSQKKKRRRKWIERLHNNTCVITKISVDKSPF